MTASSSVSTALPSPPNTATGTSAAAAAAAAAATAQLAADTWFEAKLVLRTLPNTETGWEQLRSGARDGPVFIKMLTEASQRAGIPRGQLLRAVLPFDESTNSNDQASVVQVGVRGGAGAPSIAVLSTLDTQSANELRSRAVALRRLLRVKMADEADLLQAGAAADMLGKFVRAVESLAALRGCSPVSVVRGLE